MINVVITDKHGNQRACGFERKEITLGRGELNDLVLDDGTVSKHHARLVKRDEQLILVDLRSDNGVFVNHRRLRSPQVVSAADEIRIGTFLIKVLDPKPEQGTKGRTVCPRCGGPLRYKRLADWCPACDLTFA